jgi:AraC-like DNA-binding protein
MNHVSESAGSDQVGAGQIQLADFDIYAAVLSRIDIMVMLAGGEQANWHIDRCSLDCVTLQHEREGAANVWMGVMPKDVIALRMKTSTGSAPARANGRAVAPGDIIVLPPEKPFLLSSGAAGDWISVFLKTGGSRVSGTTLVEYANGRLREGVSVVSTVPVLVARVVELATRIREATDRAEVSSHAPSAAELERLLIDLLVVAATSHQDEPRRLPGRRRARSEEIVLRAVEFVRRQSKALPTVQSLCAAISAPDRTLRRAFHFLLGMGPADFLKVYQLNYVRRTMLSEASPSLPVTRLLASCSVTEFGRFAGEYKALFGELPSETRKRSLEELSYA